MEQIKSNLKAVVGSSKSGIPLNKLEEEYKRVTNSTLPFWKYSETLEDFIRSANDVVQLRQFGNTCYVILVTTESDPQCLKNLFDLIQNTRNRKAAKSATHVPQNVLARANQFSNLRISLTNELCAPTRSPAFDPKNLYNQYSQQTSQCNGFSRSAGNSAYKKGDNVPLPRPRSLARQTQAYNNSHTPKNGTRSPNELHNNSNSDYRSRIYSKYLEQNCNDNNQSTYKNCNVNNQSANKSHIKSNQSTVKAFSGNHQSEQRLNVVNNQSEQTENVENNQSQQISNVKNNQSNQRSQIESSRPEQKSNDKNYQLERRSNVENNHSNQISQIKKSQSEQKFNIENNQSEQISNIDNKKSGLTKDTDDHCQSESKIESKADQLASVARTPPRGLMVSHCTSNGVESEPLLWPMNIENNVQILHRQVKILGIQSGYALVSVFETMPKSQYVDARPIGVAIGYPGDILIWQPPIIDPDRPAFTIDTATAFPVVLIGRLVSNNRNGNSSNGSAVTNSPAQGLVRVRVLGQRVLIAVETAHLFWPGRRAHSALLARWRARQTSLCRLAAVPGFIDLWEVGGVNNGGALSLLEGTFFAPVSVGCSEISGSTDNGGGDPEFVFERCERRGDFLNCALLMHGSVVPVPLLGIGQQRIFVQLWLAHLLECKRALRPCFEAMLDVTGSAPDSPSSLTGAGSTGAVTGMSLMASEASALLPITDLSKCENRMLIGCPYLFSGGTVHQGPRDAGTVGRPDLHLERLVFNSGTREFQYFDNNLHKANVVLPEISSGAEAGVGGDRVPPLHGIYILNERFVNSRLSHVSMLRFQAALLLLPDFSRLRQGAQPPVKTEMQTHQ